MSTINGSFNPYEDNYKVLYEITDEMKDKIIFALLKYYEECGHMAEIIHQSDEAIFETPNVLSNICDKIIKFKSSYTEDEEAN